MAIHLDIMDNEFIGPPIRQKVEEAVEEARTKGQIDFVPGQMKKRFGRVPPRIGKRLATLKNSEQIIEVV
jgi:dissimilatory sulfite reductase (desulfoviridin) alpha/beta subunit